jgi:hypothetical protein
MARSGEATPMEVTAGSVVSLMPSGNLSGGRFLDTDSTGMSVRFCMSTTTARPYLERLGKVVDHTHSGSGAIAA